MGWQWVVLVVCKLASSTYMPVCTISGGNVSSHDIQMLSDLHLETGEVAVGVQALGSANTGVHIAPECGLHPGTAYRTGPLDQCRGQASSTPAVLAAMCSTAEMGPLQLVDGVLCHNPANLVLHGVRLPL